MRLTAAVRRLVISEAQKTIRLLFATSRPRAGKRILRQPHGCEIVPRTKDHDAQALRWREIKGKDYALGVKSQPDNSLTAFISFMQLRACQGGHHCWCID